MLESSPGDVREATLADDLKRMRLTRRAARLERVIEAMRAEYEQRSGERLPPMGLKLALDEYTHEAAEVRRALKALPQRPEPRQGVLGRPTVGGTS
jgi:hypothetical protein